MAACDARRGAAGETGRAEEAGAIKWFQSDRDVQGGALKAFRSLLCWECATYKDLTEKLSESYNVVLRVLVGDNEKQSRPEWPSTCSTTRATASRRTSCSCSTSACRGRQDGGDTVTWTPRRAPGDRNTWPPAAGCYGAGTLARQGPIRTMPSFSTDETVGTFRCKSRPRSAEDDRLTDGSENQTLLPNAEK